MKVCIDVQPAIAQRAGVGRYTRLLVQHLAAGAGSDNLRLFYFDFRRRGSGLDAPRACEQVVRWCPGRLAALAWKTLDWPPFDWLAGPADLYHFPNFIVPPLRRGRTVVTIHDMSFLRFPEFAEERNRRYLTARIRDTAARADAIITDSAFSAAEIRDLLRVDSRKIFAVHLGVALEGGPLSAVQAQAAVRRLGITRPYLLTVGTIEPRKNLPFLIDVFERLPDFTGELVLAGMLGWKYGETLQRLRGSPRRRDLRLLRYVSDRDLTALYTLADVFVFPSFYEGFGLPPLEAMACGTPVVSSARASLREVLGEGAWLLDTFEADTWAGSIRQVRADAGLRERLVRAGRRRAAEFTWEKTARATWEVYRQAGL